MNLVKDSQFINENLPDEKMSSIISGALDRLHQSADPCVKYDQEKKIWMYSLPIPILLDTSTTTETRTTPTGSSPEARSRPPATPRSRT